MIGLIISFLAGAILTLILFLLCLVFLFYSQPLAVHHANFNTTRQYTRLEFPKLLEEVCTRLKNSSDGLQDESCVWFNLIVDFLFKELRDTPRIKRLVMKKIEKEFQELLFTKTEGRILEQLTVREYFLGVSMPVITSVSVVEVECSTDQVKSLQKIEIAIEVEYTGNCEIAIDADLLFNKAAYVAVKLKQVRGRVRLLFTRQPVTNWSFSFYEEPYLDLKVDSHFEGRDFPQLSSFIEAQCRKYVKRKHTLPASKTRYKPFFKKHKPQDQLLDLYIHDHRLTMGKLSVEVVKCSRLPQFDGASKVYCTLGVAALPWKPMIHLWKTQWPVMEFIVNKLPGQTIGMKNRKEVYEDEEESNVLILVSDIIPYSAAHVAGLMKGDVVTRVNNVKINSVKQVTRLINKAKGKSPSICLELVSLLFVLVCYVVQFAAAVKRRKMMVKCLQSQIVLITVIRPPAHFSTKFLHIGAGTSSFDSAPSVTTTPNTVTVSEVLKDISGASDTCVGETGSTHQEADQSNSSEAEGFSRMGQNDSDNLTSSGETIESELFSTEQTGKGQLRRRHPPGVNIPSGKAPLELQGVISVESEKISHESGLDPSSSHFANNSPHPPVVSVNDDDEAVADLPHADIDLTSAQLLTRAVQACKTPEWNQALKFNIEESHSYLNICVWVKLDDERGNLLIGHMTVSLTDIALQCLCTSSGTHRQNYVLVAAEAAKAYANRVALQATSSTGSKGSGGKDVDSAYAGDIFLILKHIPSFDVHCVDKGYEQTEDRICAETYQRSHHPFTPSEGSMPSDHNFIGVEMDGLHRKCDICSKKIWVLKSKVQECQKCGLKCHKRCIDYCTKQVPCYQKTFEDLQQRSEGDFAVYEREELGVQISNGHRLLDQQRTGSINSTESSSFETLVTVADRERENVKGEEFHLQPNACEEISICPYPFSGSEYDPSETLDEDQYTSWLPNLPQQECSLEEKITSLQQEVERINKLIEEVQTHDRPEMSLTERERIQHQIAQHEDKLNPLKLLLMQLNMELNDRSSENNSSHEPLPE